MHFSSFYLYCFLIEVVFFVGPRAFLFDFLFLHSIVPLLFFLKNSPFVIFVFFLVSSSFCFHGIIGGFVLDIRSSLSFALGKEREYEGKSFDGLTKFI